MVPGPGTTRARLRAAIDLARSGLLGGTITATLDWNQPLPTPPAAATAVGLPLAAGITIDAFLTYRSHSGPTVTEADPHPTCIPPPVVGGASASDEQRQPDRSRVEGQLRTAA